MATISVEKLSHVRDGITIFKWAAMADGDDGEPIVFPERNDKTVQVTRDFGAAGQIDMEGTLLPDSPVWALLADPQGNALSITSPKIETVLENVFSFRPRVAAGAGVDVDVYLMVR